MPVYLHEITLDEFPVRAALLQGANFRLVWDTLSHPDDMAEIAARSAGRPTFIVYSHADWDHVWGTAAFERNTPIIAHHLGRERFATDLPQTLADFRRDQPGKWEAIELRPPLLTFGRDMDVDLGGLTVQLRHLPGHTPDSIVAFAPELNLLLAGDAVEWPCPCVPKNCDLEAWIEALRSWRAQPGLRVVPSHGPEGGAELLDHAIAYLDALRHGRPAVVPANMPDFYARTHQDNLRHVARAEETERGKILHP